MKKTFLFFLLIAALTSIFYTSCEPVDEDTTGDLRDQYIGKWGFIESLKSTESQNYIVTITYDPQNSSQVILENFGNSGPGVFIYGLVTSSQIVVSSQTMSNGWKVEGSGRMSNAAKTEMAWDYSLLIGPDLEPHSAIATRQ